MVSFKVVELIKEKFTSTEFVFIGGIPCIRGTRTRVALVNSNMSAPSAKLLESLYDRN